MNEKASKYLIVETVSSAVFNCILNLFFAYLLFHARPLVPIGGSHGLAADSIGETFFATFLSTLIPFLIARRRRRAGVLPLAEPQHTSPAGNLYVRSFVVGLLFTMVCVPINAWLLPRLLPAGASLHQVLWFKTLYGTIFGALATYLALHKALHEPTLLLKEIPTNAQELR